MKYIVDKRNEFWVIIKTENEQILYSCYDEEQARQTCQSMNSLMQDWPEVKL